MNASLAPLVWLAIGAGGALLCVGVYQLVRRWYRQWRYGPPIEHEVLLNAYGRQLAGTLEGGDVERLLAEGIPSELGVSRAVALLRDGHELATAHDGNLQLPVHHAAVRRVASSGGVMPVAGRLRHLVEQGRTDLRWTAAWVPLMRGTDLHGIWLLGQRAEGRAYSPEDLRWLTTLARQAAVVLETIRHAEQEQQLASEMMALYRQAVSARESERERLSRELHDGVLQDLCAVARDLKALAAEPNNVASYETLAANSNESVQMLRAICHDLRPPLLTNNPTMALKALVERLDSQSPVPIHIEITAPDLSVPDETALAIFRIAQEALHNAIQHADASEIAVRLTEYPDRLRMTVTDDGKGFTGGTDTGRFVAEGHFGLAGMRERAAMIGGSLEVQSAPDYGTVVVLELPSAGAEPAGRP